MQICVVNIFITNTPNETPIWQHMLYGGLTLYNIKIGVVTYE